MPDTIPVATGRFQYLYPCYTVTISPAKGNANLGFPSPTPNSNIVAEINANGNNLGDVTTSFYINSGAEREIVFNKNLYLDRNITITPTNQPLSKQSCKSEAPISPMPNTIPSRQLIIQRAFPVVLPMFQVLVYLKTMMFVVQPIAVRLRS